MLHHDASFLSILLVLISTSVVVFHGSVSMFCVTIMQQENAAENMHGHA